MDSKLDPATENMIRNLEKNSGRSFADWIAEARALGDAKHGEIVAHLKTKHALGHGYANLVAHSARADETKPAASTDDTVDSWFAGDKAAIRPIYDAVMAAIRGFGGDVELAPKKGYMSLRRSKQFVCLHPSTKTRVDVGIQLKGVEPAGRLEKAGSWNAMVSHRVRLENVAQVDAELVAWLRRAYEAA
jgi:hypothetical protein